MTNPITSEEWKALSERASKLPWATYNMIHAERGDAMTPEEIGEYVVGCVWKSREDGGSDNFLFVTTGEADGPDICHVGNGPRGPHNAALLTFAVNNFTQLLKERDEAVARAEVYYQALGEICKDSNPDWTEKRVYPTDVLDDIHRIAVDAYWHKAGDTHATFTPETPNDH